MSSRAPVTEPDPSLIMETLTAYQRTAALRAAIQLGVFGAVGQGPGTADQIAKRCSASTRGIRILCDYLTIHGLLAKADGTYQHSPTSARFLDPASPACLAKTVGFLSLPEIREPFERLTEVVRHGTTVLPGAGTVEPENFIWVEFAHSMAPMMAAVAPALASLALEGRSGPLRVLDIAAGHGLFGIAVATRNPQARIVAVDWAPVLAVAEENARKAGVGDRFEKLPGSAFEVELGGPHDLTLVTNFVHHFDAPTCVSFYRKVRAAMRPGGVVATLEFVPNPDRVSPPMAAGFSLSMLATTVAGDAYTFEELKGMQVAAGFTDIKQHAVPDSPFTVVLGRVPERG